MFEPLQPKYEIGSKKKKKEAKAGGMKPLERVFKLGKKGQDNNPQLMAQRALDSQRAEKLAQEAKEERAGRLRQVRSEIQTLKASQDLTPARLQPTIQGWASIIARVSEDDPEEALEIAREVFSDAKDHNDLIKSLRRTKNESEEARRSHIRRLEEEPLESLRVKWGKNIDPSKGKSSLSKGFLKAGKATAEAAAFGATLASRSIAAGLTLTSPFNTITISGKGLVIDSPGAEHAHMEYGAETALKDISLSPNPPKWWDKTLGGVLSVAGINWAPLGKVEVMHNQGNYKAEAVVWGNPYKKVREMNAALGKLKKVNLSIPEPKPEPTMSDLLERVAKDTRRVKPVDEVDETGAVG